MEKHLHIVVFDVPSPPNYGGVIDVYYKVKALHEAGIKVHLHCFEYGRKLGKELTEICFSLKSYPRKTAKSLLLKSQPYIVASRESEVLVKNLVKDKYPVLFEGLHCCFHLNDFRLAHRPKYVRLHNIEHDYYAGLAKAEKNVFKRLYFNSEAAKLKTFEAQLKGAEKLFAISPADTNYYQAKFSKTNYVPAFHQFTEVTSEPGNGDFAFYHGNLSVAENNEAALFLVNQVFNDIPHKLIIAGNHPSKELQQAVAKLPNIELQAISDNDKIQELIRTAHINVLPTFQNTGIKLKLLNSLFSGKHCLVNKPMIENTTLEPLVTVAGTGFDFKNCIKDLFTVPFTDKEIEKRKQLLFPEFCNKTNAEKLIKEIFN